MSCEIQLHVLSPGSAPSPRRIFTGGIKAGNHVVLLYQTPEKMTTVKIIENSRDLREKTFKKGSVLRKKHWKFF
jgi:hypothetical protein